MFFVQMSGFPGSGKSTLAREIGKRTGAVVVDHDIVKSALLEGLEDASLDLRKAGVASYSVDWSLLEFHLSQGHAVVMDSPCFYDEIVEKGTALAKKYNVKYKYVQCYLNDLDEINHRLQERVTMPCQYSEFKSEELFQQALVKSKKPSQYDWLVVNSALPFEDYIDEVMEYINR